jgi:hypothetical protein
MTQNVSELLRLLRQRPQPEIETSEEEVNPLKSMVFDASEAASSTPLPRTQALPIQDKPIRSLRSYQLASIPVDQIRIDPHQPRRTLPDDLRDACALGRLSPREALLELCRRAQDGDAVIALRVKQLRELADNIRKVGLEYPPKVAKVTTKGGTVIYQLVDGERRFWAWLLLLAAADDGERVHRQSIPAMVEDDDANAEQILRSQWATNLHRENVPVVDIADYVLSVRDTYASRLQSNPQPWMETLDAEGAAMSVPSAVLALTRREVAAAMGRQMSRATMFRYLAIAEKMRADVKAIARVRQFSLRQCEWLSRLSPAQQLEAAQRMKLVDQDYEGDTPEVDDAERAGITGAGRPRLLDGRITLLVRVAGEVVKEKESNLRKADAVKLQELRQATTDAIDALQSYVRLIDRSLHAGTPKDATSL